ncbi:MAG: hypothetical protein VX589_13425 [Myxococcota bacterium]|nr:hypothetical protein [Myxococcota bacterium]
MIITGCSGPSPAKSPWAFATTSFSTSLFDAEFRARHFTDNANRALKFIDQNKGQTYEFLHLAELNYPNGPVQYGRVAIRIDGWPAQLSFAMSRTDDGFRMTRVGSTMSVRHLLVLLGPQGLATVPEARPWHGGLSGQDMDGRPNAAVVVAVVGDLVYVDGHERLKYERAPVERAIRNAIQRRTKIAQDAFATYQPRVAIAMMRSAPALMSADLTQWSFEAGAKGVHFLVKRKDGSPGFLDVGRTTTEVSTDHGPVVRLHVAHHGVRMTQENGREGAASLIVEGPSVVAALDNMPARYTVEEPMAGMIIETTQVGEHQRFVETLGAVFQALPELPVALDIR